MSVCEDATLLFSNYRIALILMMMNYVVYPDIGGIAHENTSVPGCY